VRSSSPWPRFSVASLSSLVVVVVVHLTRPAFTRDYPCSGSFNLESFTLFPAGSAEDWDGPESEAARRFWGNICRWAERCVAGSANVASDSLLDTLWVAKRAYDLHAFPQPCCSFVGKTLVLCNAQILGQRLNLTHRQWIDSIYA